MLASRIGSEPSGTTTRGCGSAPFPNGTPMNRLLVVLHTEKGQEIRRISYRRATKTDAEPSLSSNPIYMKAIGQLMLCQVRMLRRKSWLACATVVSASIHFSFQPAGSDGVRQDPVWFTDPDLSASFEYGDALPRRPQRTCSAGTRRTFPKPPPVLRGRPATRSVCEGR